MAGPSRPESGAGSFVIATLTQPVPAARHRASRVANSLTKPSKSKENCLHLRCYVSVRGMENFSRRRSILSVPFRPLRWTCDGFTARMQ